MTEMAIGALVIYTVSIIIIVELGHYIIRSIKQGLKIRRLEKEMKTECIDDKTLETKRKYR